MPGKRKTRANSKDYNFLDSVRRIQRIAADRNKGVNSRPLSGKEFDLAGGGNPKPAGADQGAQYAAPPLEPYTPLGFTGLNTLLAGAGMSADQAAAQAEAKAMWAKALMAMAADKALRNEEDELFLLLCAAA